MTKDGASNRRDFMTARAALNRIRDAAKAAEQNSASQPPVPSINDAQQTHYLAHHSKRAMACEFELYFNLNQYESAGEQALQIFELIDQLEDQLSIYRSHSEVSQINQKASFLADEESSWVEVTPELCDLLAQGIDLSQQTLGAFDMTSTPLSKVWGFHQRQGRVPNEHEIEAARQEVGYKNLILNEANHEIQFLKAGLSLNLGGIGKGYALDRAAKHLGQHGIDDFVLHGGQSSVIARGRETKPDSSQENGWSIGLSHPNIPEKRLAIIHLKNQALGTSGTGRQGFFHQGKRYGHIIDPRSGWPTDHCLSSTVIADSAATCDALATAFFVMTPTEVKIFCEEHQNVKAVLVLPVGKSGQIEIVTHNLTDDEITILQNKI